jgi:hypothetical protein
MGGRRGREANIEHHYGVLVLGCLQEKAGKALSYTMTVPSGLDLMCHIGTN